MDTFREIVWNYYHAHGRTMPWRDTPSFYYVLVSELMLQQTQVSRVLPKFQAFTRQFPTIQSVAEASLAEVIEQWVGLGYNRRAKYLHQACQMVVVCGQPRDAKGLQALPGVGVNTAAAIMNYVYNVPVPFVETNIRTVYLNHFFPNQIGVSDRQLLEQVGHTIDRDNPREWFWALMDYGAFVKSQGMGLLAHSKHYKKQAPLKGSIRQVRGQIIKELSAGSVTAACLEGKFARDTRYLAALQGLIKDGLIEQTKGAFHLTK